MDVTKLIALDRGTLSDLVLWLAQYITGKFEQHPQQRAVVLPHWDQVPPSPAAQSTWIALIRDTPYLGWQDFDPPVLVDTNRHFLSIPVRIALRVDVFDGGLVVLGTCQDNQALGFFGELMKEMEDAWPKVTDHQGVSTPPSPERRESSRFQLSANSDGVEPIAMRAAGEKDAPKVDASTPTADPTEAAEVEHEEGTSKVDTPIHDRKTRLPRRGEYRRKWKATWELIRPKVEEGATMAQIQTHILDKRKDLWAHDDTLRKIIAAGERGELD